MQIKKIQTHIFGPSINLVSIQFRIFPARDAPILAHTDMTVCGFQIKFYFNRLDNQEVKNVLF